MLVVGGGPAGAAAARTLALGGTRVAVLDRYRFPRDKLCGGLLTLRSRRIYDLVFDTPWEPVIETRARGIGFFHHRQALNAIQDYKDLEFTCRTQFDAFLLQQAERAGATLKLGTAVRSVDAQGCALTLADGRTFVADHLIGADGVGSVIAKALYGRAFDKRTIALGLEMEVPLGDGVAAVTDPEIYFGVVRWGYGWVFPKRATLTVGIGGLCSRNADFKQSFESFLRERFGSVPQARIKGHYLPFGDYRRSPGRDRVLLCGDAAGLVEPLTGEGIAFAMQSGHLAGRAILESAAGGAGALGRYTGYCADIIRALDHARRLRWLVFPRLAEHVFLNVFPRTHSLVRKHMDLMADELEYGDYARYLASRIGRGMLGLLRREPPLR